MELYIVRHGETDWNKKKMIQGRADIDMNETGKGQVVKLADALSDVSFDLVYASPLKRAIETASIISHQKDIIIDERLYEIDFGELEGVVYKDIDNLKIEDLDGKLKKVKTFFSSPEMYISEDGESYESLYKRIGSFLDELEEKYKYKKILVVSHATCIHAMLTYIKRLSVKDTWQIHLPNCSVSKIILEKDGFKIIEEGRTY